jgi:hypothetical protein
MCSAPFLAKKRLATVNRRGVHQVKFFKDYTRQADKRLLRLGLVSSGDDDLGARTAKRPHRFDSDSRISTRDDRDLARQVASLNDIGRRCGGPEPRTYWCLWSAHEASRKLSYERYSPGGASNRPLTKA